MTTALEGLRYDTLPHFQIFQSILSYGTNGSLWPKTESGLAFIGFNYPQHFHEFLVTIKVIIDGSGLGNFEENIASYFKSLSLFFMLIIVIFSAALIALLKKSGIRTSFIYSAVFLSSYTLFMGPGAKIIGDGFSAALIAGIGSALCILLCILFLKEQSFIFLIAAASTLIMVSQIWPLIAPAPAVIFCLVAILKFLPLLKHWRVITFGMITRTLILAGIAVALVTLSTTLIFDTFPNKSNIFAGFISISSAPGGVTLVSPTLFVSLCLIGILVSIVNLSVSPQAGDKDGIVFIVAFTSVLVTGMLLMGASILNTKELNYYPKKYVLVSLSIILPLLVISIVKLVDGSIQALQKREKPLNIQAGISSVILVIGISLSFGSPIEFGEKLPRDFPGEYINGYTSPGAALRHDLLITTTKALPGYVERIIRASSFIDTHESECIYIYLDLGPDFRPYGRDGVNQWAQALAGTWRSITTDGPYNQFLSPVQNKAVEGKEFVNLAIEMAESSPGYCFITESEKLLSLGIPSFVDPR